MGLFGKHPKLRDAVFTKACSDILEIGCECMVTRPYREGVLLALDGVRSYRYSCNDCGGFIYLPAYLVEDTEEK